MSAPFDLKIYDGFGKDLGFKILVIEFNSEKQFEISGITDMNNTTWKKQVNAGLKQNNTFSRHHKSISSFSAIRRTGRFIVSGIRHYR